MSGWNEEQAIQWALLVAIFLAAALAAEGLVLIWQQTRSPGMLRFKRRIAAWVPKAPVERAGIDARRARPGATGAGHAGANAGAQTGGQANMGTALASWREPLWRWIDQAGWSWTPNQLMGLSAALGALGAVLMGAAAQSSGASMPFAILCGTLGFGATPWIMLLWKRRQRLTLMNRQLPDALELIARAMRSGHAFAPAVQMVGQEGAAPLSQEFQWVHDQVAYGRDINDAFDALSHRVPLDDVRFFVTAVRVQRQTGGNLAELLHSIGSLIRERLKLAAKVRALGSEGRLSAQILALLPLATAGLIYLVRPEFIRVLWTDPAGIALVQASTALFLIGLVWMWRLTRLKL